MNGQDIQTLYGYNCWANRRILAASARVGPAQFAEPVGLNYGTLRGSLVHTLDTEYGWRMLVQHNQRTPEMPEADFPTVEALAERWDAEEVDMRAYLASLSDQDLVRVVRYTNDSGEPRERVLWHVLALIVYHGTQHRCEAAVILTNYGQSPGELDLPLFLNERG
jgi:uncharacterized damage-inducible protein DinB